MSRSLFLLLILIQPLGSLPPTRGTQVSKYFSDPERRITPAYAGNTLMYCHPCLCLWDHPRLRGEHKLKIIRQKTYMGSPPPTRGTLFKGLAPLNSGIITPAYAGNTCFAFFVGCVPWDHPRLRGEHHPLRSMFAKLLGSPPPTRGTHAKTNGGEDTLRITPAYAGNTVYVIIKYPYRGDHPRLRGEHSMA